MRGQIGSTIFLGPEVADGVEVMPGAPAWTRSIWYGRDHAIQVTFVPDGTAFSLELEDRVPRTFLEKLRQAILARFR